MAVVNSIFGFVTCAIVVGGIVDEVLIRAFRLARAAAVFGVTDLTGRAIVFKVAEEVLARETIIVRTDTVMTVIIALCTKWLVII